MLVCVNACKTTLAFTVTQCEQSGLKLQVNFTGVILALVPLFLAFSEPSLSLRKSGRWAFVREEKTCSAEWKWTLTFMTQSVMMNVCFTAPDGLLEESYCFWLNFFLRVSNSPSECVADCFLVPSHQFWHFCWVSSPVLSDKPLFVSSWLFPSGGLVCQTGGLANTSRPLVTDSRPPTLSLTWAKWKEKKCCGKTPE